jgi:hypothetical protein
MISIPHQELKEFLDDVMTLIAGISWFNVDEEKKRVYLFFDKYMIKIIELEKIYTSRNTR